MGLFSGVQDEAATGVLLPGRAVDAERKRVAARAEARGRLADQFAAQVEAETAPDWFREYVDSRPLPDGVETQWAWTLRYRASERSAALELWWMFCFLDNYLTVPSGLLRGSRFVLQDWQREFLGKAFATGVTEATLSAARKNGKSGLICALGAYFLSRYGSRRGWRGLAVSVGGPQCEQLFSDLHELLYASGLYDVLDVDTGAPLIRSLRRMPGRFVTSHDVSFRMMTSNPRASGVGASADLIILDEIGAYPENSRSLVRNMETSTSARSGKTVAISVEGVQNSFMSEREDRAQRDPAFVYVAYRAPEGCALDDSRAWAAANPGLGTIKSLDYMRAESFKALTNPADQSSFRNLELNQRVSDVADTICTPDDWGKIETDDLPQRAGPMICGIDLGGARAFSACVAVWPETGRMEGLLAIGGLPSLMDRGRSDGVDNRYVRMHDEGLLHVFEGSELVEHDRFIALIETRLGAPDLCLADEYKRHEFGMALRTAGASWAVQLRRMGNGPSGGEDVRSFMRMIVRGELSVIKSLSWRAAIAETMVKYHPVTRWPSIRPRRAVARIDLVAAATLACGAASRWADERKAIEADEASSSPATAIMPW